MTQQATATQPKVKLTPLTLSRETVRQLAGGEPGEARKGTLHGGCLTHGHTYCVTVCGCG